MSVQFEIVLSEDGQQDKLAKGVANQFKALQVTKKLPESTRKCSSSCR